MTIVLLAIIGLSAFAMGYMIGSARTYARCFFLDEGLDSILATLRPYCGNRGWRRMDKTYL